MIQQNTDTVWLRDFAETGRRGMSGRIFMSKEADSLIAVADEIERLRAREADMTRAIHIWVAELTGHLGKLGDILKEPPRE